MEIVKKQSGEIETTISRFILQYIDENKYNKLRIFSNKEIQILQLILKNELNYDILEEELEKTLYIIATKLYYEAFEKKFITDNPDLGTDFHNWVKSYIKTFDSNYDFVDFFINKMEELQIDFPTNTDIQDIEDFLILMKKSDNRLYYDLLNSQNDLEDINIMLNPSEEVAYEDLKIIYYLFNQQIESWKCAYLLIYIQREIENARLKLLAEEHIKNMANGGKIRKDYISISDIDTMNGIDFEHTLAYLFKKMNYNVEVTQASNDQGADLIIEKLEERTVVQAKCYSYTVGNTAIQEVTGAKQFYNCTKAMVVTNNYFTKSAVELALANNVELKDRDDLISWLETYPVYLEDTSV